MTSQEVVWFINHKYGEQAYVFETQDVVKIYTHKSTWLINKNDYKRFGKYELFHSNNVTHVGFHKQMAGLTIPYLVYQAVLHDNDGIFSTRATWDKFKQSWNLYLFGRQLWKSVCEWDEDCVCEAYMNGEYD